MDFNEKLQQLRKEKGLTQEELAEKLYVSRTAISKWESGRGLPSIDSLKEISKLFSVTIDDLLSGEELLEIAEVENKEKTRNLRNLMYGISDCMVALLYLLPFFGQYDGSIWHSVPLLSFSRDNGYIQLIFILFTNISVVFGIAELALQNLTNRIWCKCAVAASLSLSAAGTMIFIICKQPYAAAFLLCLLIVKGCLFLKRQ